MAESDSQDEEYEPEQFALKLDPSKLYSLNSMLNYLSMEFAGTYNGFVADQIAKDVHEVMVSSEFDNALEEEMDEFHEEHQHEMGQMGSTQNNQMFNKNGFQ